MLFTYSLVGNKVGNTGALALAECLQCCTDLKKLLKVMYTPFIFLPPNILPPLDDIW